MREDDDGLLQSIYEDERKRERKRVRARGDIKGDEREDNSRRLEKGVNGIPNMGDCLFGQF